MAPTPEFTASIKAMRDDAAGWAGVAAVLNLAAGAASTLHLTKKEWSFVADDVGLDSTYEQIRSTCERLLREGDTNIGALSNMLTTVANAYETNDEKASSDYAKIWVPKR